MKNIITISILFGLMACRQPVDKTVLGTWQVQNKYYTATYNIIEEQRTVKGQVLSYDDGTSRYKWNADNPKYIFQDLKTDDGQLVDGISGATTKAETQPTFAITIKHRDTLEVVNHYSTEQWIRKN